MASSSSSSSGNPDPLNMYSPVNFQHVKDTISTLQQRLSTKRSGSVLETSDQNHPENLYRDLDYIMDVFSNLDESLGSEVSTSMNELGKKLDNLLTTIENNAGRVQDLFHELSNSITVLKSRLPNSPLDDGLPENSFTKGKRVIGDRFWVDPEISSLYNRGVHQYGVTTVDEFTEIFNGLHDQTRKLLFFFSVFPSGSVINKRVMKNWWDGEGMVDLSSTDEAEEMTNLLVEKLMERCLIKPVREKCALIGFKMNPLIRPMVVGEAKQSGFFSVDSQGNLTRQISESSRAFLVNGKRQSPNELGPASSHPDSALRKVQTLFNIDESYPDFTLDLFLKLRNLKVLSLGQWQSSSDRHIELESTQFLEALKYMKSLRYFSLRGMSRIDELPDVVCKLGSLRILDLNACHNLEELPDSIGSLKKLISLDMSECYLLDRMPKSLALLAGLRILKGFLVSSDTAGGCSFTDLGELKKLIKLSVNVHRGNFPNTDDLGTFQKFELLKKLTISWNVKSKSRSAKEPPKKSLSTISTMFKQQNDPIKPEEVPKDCFKSLKKLNLQCYPDKEVWWLNAHHFNILKKLCIQGGNLKKWPTNDCWIKVESLHLKFLSDLSSSMNLKSSFPQLTYLEIVGCDKLEIFGFDEMLLNEQRRATHHIQTHPVQTHPVQTHRIQNDVVRTVVQGSIWLK